MLLEKTEVITAAREIHKRPDLLPFLSGKETLDVVFSLPNNLKAERIDLYRKAYFGVGKTECYKINLPNSNKLYLKMEYANAMGNTHYARYWIIYLFIAEILGVINPNQTKILEVTSGSSGIALSMAAELLDYDVTILVPSLLPESRIDPMRRKTTTIVKVDGYINDCIIKLREMLENDNYYATNHSEEHADIITHVFSRIGHEVIQDGINPDFAILGMGNGTSTQAISKVLKDELSKVKIISYRPHYEKYPDDIVFGLIGANIECRHVPLAEKLVDDIKFTTGVPVEKVSDRYQYDTEIRNLGYSSLYGIYYALELAKTVYNKSILSIGYDKIDRY